MRNTEENFGHFNEHIRFADLRSGMNVQARYIHLVLIHNLHNMWNLVYRNSKL